MMIQLKEVRTTHEKKQLYQLRYQVFIEEEKRFTLSVDHIYDRFDSFDETANFLALHHDQPIAAIRLVLDNPAGLPAQSAFDFDPLRRTIDGGCANVGWFCVLKAYQRNPGLVVSLIQMCFRRMRQNNARHVLSVLHPPIFPHMHRLVGARALSETIPDPQLGVEVVPVHVDLKDLPAGNRERFVDPEPRVLADSHLRRLYKKGTVIYRLGDSAHEVLQVMRGVVQRQFGSQTVSGNSEENTEGMAVLLGPGQFVGELSVIDNTPRETTLTAHTDDVDLMVWRRDEFLEQVHAAPGRMMDLYRLMARSVHRTMMGTPADSSQLLAARLLLGASGKGRQPVDTRWLARQCGMNRKSLSTMVTPWEKAQLIAADDRLSRIWVIDRNRLARAAQV